MSASPDTPQLNTSELTDTSEILLAQSFEPGKTNIVPKRKRNALLKKLFWIFLFVFCAAFITAMVLIIIFVEPPPPPPPPKP